MTRMVKFRLQYRMDLYAVGAVGFTCCEMYRTLRLKLITVLVCFFNCPLDTYKTFWRLSSVSPSVIFRTSNSTSTLSQRNAGVSSGICNTNLPLSVYTESKFSQIHLKINAIKSHRSTYFFERSAVSSFFYRLFRSQQYRFS